MDEKREWRVGIWAAVSSKPQAQDDKVSLPVQIENGKAFAEAIGGTVTAIYEVHGHSRDYIFLSDAAREMDAYRKLQRDVENGTVNLLYVHHTDRLGRRAGLIHQVIDVIEAANGEVFFASAPHPIGQRTVSHDYVVSIDAVRSQQDQARRIEQHQWGMAARVKRGLHAGTWPYGYRPAHDAGGKVVGGELDETEAGAVRIITRLFLEGLPYRAIAHHMDTTPYRPRKVDHWPWMTVIRILHNDTYAGYVRFNDISAHSDKFPAIWDRATHTAVMRERKRRKNARHRRTNSPLLHVAYCARCGGPMHRETVHAHGRIYRYLTCQAHKVAGRTCHKNRIPEGEVRDALLAYLRGALTDEAIEGALADRANATADLEGRADKVEQRLADIAEQRKRLALAYAAGQMEVGIYGQADGELRAQSDALEATRWELQQQIVAVPDLEQRRRAAQMLRARVDRLFEKGYEANSLLRDAGIQILIEEGEIVEIRVT